LSVPEFPHASPDTIQRDVAKHAEKTDPDVKYSKDEVNYRPAGSSNTRCERCKHFSRAKGGGGSGSCKVVAGSISPSMVCDEYGSGGTGLTDLITGEATH